jgi:RNA polymerase sigma factor (sigma-70 family)
MSDAAPFTEFLRRIRAGDQTAAEELVRQYEPLIRREVRSRIEDDRLNRVFDSMDVCQSVLGSFFVRVATGAFELDRPEQLVKLLVTMARNKLASKARHEHRERRDSRRVASTEQEILEQVTDARASPFDVMSGQELIEKFRSALTSEEQQIANLRSQGLSWSDVVKKLGGTVAGRRMQLFRGIERVEKGLEGQEGLGP